MMGYFKKNPTALMDAIPTPPNEKDEDCQTFKKQPQRLLEFLHGGETNQVKSKQNATVRDRR